MPCENPPCEQVGPFRYCPIKGCGWTEADGAATQYAAIVSEAVRQHTSDLLGTWVAEGRDDRKIKDLVESLVLNAYAEGTKAGRG